MSGLAAPSPFARPVERVVVVRSSQEAAPEAPPTAVELLSQLIERQAAADRLAAERHAEVLFRLDALDARVRRAEDAADCAAIAVEESEGRVRGWIGEAIEAIDDLADALAEDSAPVLTPVD